MDVFNQRLNAHFEAWLGPRGEFGSLLPVLSEWAPRPETSLALFFDSSYFGLPLSDERVRGMLLLDGYLPTLALTLGYLLVVWMGPRYMKHRQPYSCRGAMMLYNLGITILSFGMFSEVKE